MPRHSRPRLFLCGLSLFLTMGVACSADSTACQQSISAYCWTGGANCDRTWGAAQARWCAGIPESALETCDGFDVLGVQNLDSPLLEYFDTKTGALVAIVQRGKAGVACIAGPSTFVTREHCITATVQPTCSPDAGIRDAAVID
jgi:hypothetical protein